MVGVVAWLVEACGAVVASSVAHSSGAGSPGSWGGAGGNYSNVLWSNVSGVLAPQDPPISSSLVAPALDEGSGNQAYLVDVGEGRALALDSGLDVRLVDVTAEGRDLSVAFVAEAHLLADFTGGSQIVGAAARTDPIGPERTDALARAEFRSLMRLDDEETSVTDLLSSLSTYPPYFARLAEINRQCLDEPGTARLAEVSPAEAAALRRARAKVVDVRATADYAAGHPHGAIGAATLPEGPTVVMCGHGERAASAASVLEHAGRSDLRIVSGGPDDWARTSHQTLEVGA